MIGAGVFSRLWARGEPPAAPAADPAPPSIPAPFGPALHELRCALACFDLVDEVVTAVGCEPGDRERDAHVFAAWGLACAADRVRRAYGREAAAGNA